MSAITTPFLQVCCDELEKQGKKAWLLIWDNASWHKSLAVRTWLREHNALVKTSGKGVRLLPFLLSTKTPGSTPSNPNGFMENAMSSSPTGCFRPSSSPSVFVLILDVLMKLASSIPAQVA